MNDDNDGQTVAEVLASVSLHNAEAMRYVKVACTRRAFARDLALAQRTRSKMERGLFSRGRGLCSPHSAGARVRPVVTAAAAPLQGRGESATAASCLELRATVPLGRSATAAGCSAKSC